MTAMIDIRWFVNGPGRIPIHHQYPLFSAVSRVVPAVHRSREFGLHPIRGARMSPGHLELIPQSALTIRTPVYNIPGLLVLSGKKLDLAGCPIRLGVPLVIGLSPCRSLVSPLVTIKGYMETQEFSAALRRQLDELGVSRSVIAEVVARRVLLVKQQVIVGFEVRLDKLCEEDSMRIQTSGLGGRRHLGCGLFNSSHKTNE